MSLHFPKTQRLRRPYEIRSVLAASRKLNVDGFSIRWKVRSAANLKSRICVTVRKKDVSLAVDRNRIRRLVKEFFRLHVQAFVFPVDMVVQARACKSLKYRELEHKLKLGFKKSGILN